MNIMTRNTLLTLVSAMVALPAWAGNHRYQDQARVVSVTPQIERVNNPVETCETEYVRERVYDNPRVQSRSNTGALIGGVTGGLLGSRIGKGNGRVAAAVVGAGLGAIVGDRMDNDRMYRRPTTQQSRVETRPVETCYTRDRWQEVTTGYMVDYEYQGRRYTTVTDHHPGGYIPVDVKVQPRHDRAINPGNITRIKSAPVVSGTSNRYRSLDNDRYDRRDINRYQKRHYW